jgi:hypothetical protein
MDLLAEGLASEPAPGGMIFLVLRCGTPTRRREMSKRSAERLARRTPSRQQVTPVVMTADRAVSAPPSKSRRRQECAAVRRAARAVCGELVSSPSNLHAIARTVSPVLQLDIGPSRFARAC